MYCSRCGKKKENENTECDCKTDLTCKDCGKTRTDEKKHCPCAETKTQFIEELVNEQVDGMIERALTIPVEGFLKEAEMAGFHGVVWFSWEGVTGQQISDGLKRNKKVLEQLKPENYSIMVHQNNWVLLIAVQEKKSDNLQILPVVRYLIQPQIILSGEKD